MSDKGDFQWVELAHDGAARCGVLHTAHGAIDTPCFMPVGTAGTVKGMRPQDVAKTGAQIILGNTYHLMLRPGAEEVAKQGGLHQFAHWPHPILTDSGGYQVMSLTSLRQMSPEGVKFRSHVDGSYHFLSPERSTEIQDLLDATITMAFDECTPYPASWQQAAHSMRLSMAWADRSRKSFRRRQGYGQFGIVQGGIYADLRRESLDSLMGLNFDGLAIGGLAVGEGQALMFATLNELMPFMPSDKPRYLMGVGKPADIVGAVMRGVDMFDCVLPTRSGRNGQAFTRYGAVNLRNARFADDKRPLDALCTCPGCQDFSRGYLHHLIRCQEMLGAILLTWHNLHYYQELMAGLRQAIQTHRLDEFTLEFSRQQQGGLGP